MTVPSVERRTAVITGVSGQDGSYLAELLLDKGYIVHGLSRNAASCSSPNLASLMAVGAGRLFLHSCDVMDHTSVCSLLRRVRPQEVYNLAAQSHVAMSYKQPELTAAVSGLGVVNLLEAIQEAGLGDTTRFFEASSCEIFGRASRAPVDENSAKHPQTPYGKAKLLGYLAVKHYREACGMYACSGILFNHESPRRGKSFVTRKITMAVVNIKLGKEERLSLGNLDAQRDWGHAREYVYCMWLMLQQQIPADYVIGSGVNTSVRQFVEMAFERVGMSIWWEGSSNGVGNHGIINRGSHMGKTVVTVCIDFFRPIEGEMVADTSKACTELGWQRTTSLRQLVNEMVDHDMALASTAV
ncbi:hypothetical protein CVIRNUC_000202 [Coccomyxa viridis]|uniref:GDP-mannose 4,6-dehydratase n=1 Tax=Coccomyxa viridis TaxID=1274662 RepID=A0AAV1HPW4_9CHLO|nr:hypothetical protein CVIRNUC_000202 [Coccomyxa viridis]